MKKQKFLELDRSVLEYVRKQHAFHAATKDLIDLFIPMVLDAIVEMQKTHPPGSEKRGVSRKKILDHMNAHVRDAYLEHATCAGTTKILPFRPAHLQEGGIALVVDMVCKKERSLYNRAIDHALACELIHDTGKSTQGSFVISDEQKKSQTA